MSALHIGVLAYPGCFQSEVFGIPDLLVMAGHVAAAQGSPQPSHRVSVVSPRRTVRAAGGTCVQVSAVGPVVSAVGPVDLLIVPGFELSPALDLDAVLAGLGPELAVIREQSAAGAALVSICVGAFLLAEAGVLDGRAATTSWLFADRLARRHPGVSVRPEQLVVTDRGVTTAAAFSAMYDCALDLVRGLHGPRVARGTARVALVDDARSSQTPYVDPELLPAAGREFSREVRRRLDRDLAARYDLPALARAFHVSTRTMLRRFGAETGQSPLGYLQAARVRRAQVLLESTDLTVARIAAELGYADSGTFSTVFARHSGCRPRDYRAAFRRPSEP